MTFALVLGMIGHAVASTDVSGSNPGLNWAGSLDVVRHVHTSGRVAGERVHVHGHVLDHSHDCTSPVAVAHHQVRQSKLWLQDVLGRRFRLTVLQERPPKLLEE
jgi:hypothetical protein